jgi:hypothetical protein
MDLTFLTLLGIVVVIVFGLRFNNSLNNIASRLSDTNARIDAMQQNMAMLLQAESAKLQAGMERIEGVLEARLRRDEENPDTR